MPNRIRKKNKYSSFSCVLAVLSACILLSCCEKKPESEPVSKPQQAEAVDSADRTRPPLDERFEERRRMVNHIRDVYGFDDKKVLDAMMNVPRHWFVRESEQSLAYADTPLPIGYDQTISQPFIVAFMTSLLELDETKKVLEVGTGSGYQAAILAELTPHVYTIEIIEPLGRTAKIRLKEHGFKTVEVRIGDGYKGWPAQQPFDAIIATCAPDHVPPALIEQLKPSGKMIIPVGRTFGVQNLVLLTKDEQGRVTRKSVMPVRFVPMLRDKDK